MHPRHLLAALLAGLALTAASGRTAIAAAPDGAIDTAHVSHIGWQDRRPLCPVDQQSFEVRLYALAGDLTGVRVYFKNAASTWVSAARAGARGPYDVWSAALPAASQPEARYYFELSDGGARAFASASGLGPVPPADSGWVVDFATLSHAPFGATRVNGGGTVFRVWAPGADSAAVRGEFNGWGVTRMNRVGEDFIARIASAGTNQQYKYYFYPGSWSPDARGRVLDPASYLWNSRIADPTTFPWTDSNWQTPPLDQMVVYQLNVGTFSGLNDPHGTTTFPSRFTDLAARAHELRTLGVNAVMLNPVTSTPSLQYAGYSTLNPWSPEWSYGMPDHFKAAVDALHHEGIAVLCDIVWNHVDPGTGFLWNYDGTQIYFETPAADTPWGPQAAFGRPAVDDYFADSALHWLEEYHVDGFRMDAVAYMANYPHETQGWALMQRLNDELERRWRGKVTIAENFPVQGPIVMPTKLDGAGFSAEYNGDYRYEVLYALPNNLGFSYYGYLPTVLNVPSGLTAGHQSFNYLELHDDAWGPGSHRCFKDLAPTPGVLADTARARMSVAMGVLMLTPGVPAMLMGDEWLETADWGTTAANRIDWSKRSLNAGYYAYVHDLIGLREQVAAFHADAASVPTHANYSDGVFAWIRYDDVGRLYLVIVNLGNRDFPSYLIGAPTGGAWFERLNSQSSAYGGTGMVNAAPVTAFARLQDGFPRSLDIALPRSSMVVLQAVNTLDVTADLASGPLRIDRVWPNPARGALRIGFVLPRAGQVDLSVFDTQGRRIATLQHGVLEAGAREVAWDGRDASGGRAAPGLYLVCLRTAEGTATRRAVVVR
jgi:1,4-alpha-glucan branching enzyme